MKKFLLSTLILAAATSSALPQALSELPAATLPLGGDEIIPLVQAGSTKRATVSSILPNIATLPGTLGFSQLPNATSYVSSCLSAAQLADVVAGTLLYDLTATLQFCMTAAGQRSLVWPAGSYKTSNTLVVPSGQNNIGDTSGPVDSGTKIVPVANMNAPIFKMAGQGTIKGFRFSGTANAGTPNQHCIYVNGTNNVVIERNFFAGCGAGVYLDGSSFYISIVDNFFYITYGPHIRVNSATPSGVDMIVSRNLFLGLPATATASWYFTGLGSLIASDNQLTLNQPVNGGALVFFDTPASLFGGAQLTNNVFEKDGGTAPSIYIGGSFSAPWPYLQLTNNVITGDTGPAMTVTFADRLQVIGGTLSSKSASGSIYLPSFGAVNNMLLQGVNFEGVATTTPFQAQGNSGISATIKNIKWGGTAPFLDFSALSAGGIGYLHIDGDAFGSAANPFLLPSGSFPYLLVSATKGIVAPSLPTSGGSVKGSLCIDTTGKVYVKTTSGACL